MQCDHICHWKPKHHVSLKMIKYKHFFFPLETDTSGLTTLRNFTFATAIGVICSILFVKFLCCLVGAPPDDTEKSFLLFQANTCYTKSDKSSLKAPYSAKIDIFFLSFFFF